MIYNASCARNLMNEHIDLNIESSDLNIIKQINEILRQIENACVKKLDCVETTINRLKKETVHELKFRGFTIIGITNNKYCIYWGTKPIRKRISIWIDMLSSPGWD